MKYKIGDYHRDIVARYYGRLIHRFSMKRLLRHIPKLKTIVWKQASVDLVERHLCKT